MAFAWSHLGTKLNQILRANDDPSTVLQLENAIAALRKSWSIRSAIRRRRFARNWRPEVAIGRGDSCDPRSRGSALFYSEKPGEERRPSTDPCRSAALGRCHQPKKGMWRNERAIRYVCLSVDRAKYREVILQSEALNDRGSLKALSRQIERGT